MGRKVRWKMMNQDWEKLGDTIKNTVQSAIDARNFDSLNQTIVDSINHAANGFLKDAKDKKGKKYSYYPGGNSDVQNIPYEQPVRQVSRPAVYRSMFSVKAWGYVWLAVGGSMGLICLLFLIVGMIGAVLKGGVGYIIAVALMFGFPGIIGGILAGRGMSRLKKARCFLNYIDIVGAREYCNVAELSERTGKKKVSVIKDIEYMIKKGWFRQGYLVGEKSCLIVTDNMYSQYGRLENERIRNEQEEKERRIRNQQREKEMQEKKEAEYGSLAPEIRKVIEKGDEYIRRIHECNDAIPGEEISAKISQMELVIDRIFDRVEQNPESVDDVRRLMDYYLPITVKLLDAYKELDDQPVHGENIRTSKAEIEATLDTLNDAFEKLLDDMFQDTAWDVSSDISVLRTMLAQEGLAKEDWRL